MAGSSRVLCCRVACCFVTAAILEAESGVFPSATRSHAQSISGHPPSCVTELTDQAVHLKKKIQGTGSSGGSPLRVIDGGEMGSWQHSSSAQQGYEANDAFPVNVRSLYLAGSRPYDLEITMNPVGLRLGWLFVPSRQSWHLRAHLFKTCLVMTTMPAINGLHNNVKARHSGYQPTGLTAAETPSVPLPANLSEIPLLERLAAHRAY
jgi:hypothetical protein